MWHSVRTRKILETVLWGGEQGTGGAWSKQKNRPADVIKKLGEARVVPDSLSMDVIDIVKRPEHQNQDANSNCYLIEGDFSEFPKR